MPSDDTANRLIDAMMVALGHEAEGVGGATLRPLRERLAVFVVRLDEHLASSNPPMIMCEVCHAHHFQGRCPRVTVEGFPLAPVTPPRTAFTPVAFAPPAGDSVAAADAHIMQTQANNEPPQEVYSDVEGYDPNFDYTPTEKETAEAKTWIDNLMSGGGSWADAQSLAVLLAETRHKQWSLDQSNHHGPGADGCGTVTCQVCIGKQRELTAVHAQAAHWETHADGLATKLDAEQKRSVEAEHHVEAIRADIGTALAMLDDVRRNIGASNPTEAEALYESYREAVGVLRSTIQRNAPKPRTFPRPAMVHTATAPPAAATAPAPPPAPESSSDLVVAHADPSAASSTERKRGAEGAAHCTCVHAPEQHGPNGCTVVGIISGPCGCKWFPSRRLLSVPSRVAIPRDIHEVLTRIAEFAEPPRTTVPYNPTTRERKAVHEWLAGCNVAPARWGRSEPPSWWACETCGACFNTTRPEGQWCGAGHPARLVSKHVDAAEVIDIDGHNWRGKLKARLDPDGTAESKTLMTAAVTGVKGPVAFTGAAVSHIEAGSGVRTALKDEPCSRCNGARTVVMPKMQVPCPQCSASDTATADPWAEKLARRLEARATSEESIAARAPHNGPPGYESKHRYAARVLREEADTTRGTGTRAGLAQLRANRVHEEVLADLGAPGYTREGAEPSKTEPKPLPGLAALAELDSELKRIPSMYLTADLIKAVADVRGALVAVKDVDLAHALAEWEAAVTDLRREITHREELTKKCRALLERLDTETTLRKGAEDKLAEWVGARKPS